MGVVGGGDKVEIVCPLRDQVFTHLLQLVHRERFSKVLMADLLILAEHAA